MSHYLAPAKLTWFLEIGNKRADGWHDLQSEMVTLSLADEVEIEEEGDYVLLSGETAGVEAGGNNLVSRALRLVDRKAGVSLIKNIPTGGGLGGGSADAGAVLRWAGGVSAHEALTLGSDVPFCQVGGRALVEGVGERVTPLEFIERSVTLALFDFGVSTSEVYRVFDELTQAREPRDPRNHLARAAQIVEPRVKTAIAWLTAEFGEEVVLAGSGATLFIEGHLRHDQDQWEVDSPVGRVRLRQVHTTPTGV
jgi:4-diphosphocytidyl-2-C-methyl-D-erythritol kinase